METSQPTQYGLTKYVKCPQPFYQGHTGNAYASGDILGVWCHPEDEVIWHWCNNRVTGYTIKPSSNV
jgi:hypothetical protein